MAADAAISQLFGQITGVGMPTGGTTGNGLWASAIFGERGGPVSTGQPYVVGETRPELFVPRTCGAIVPDLKGMARGGGNTTARVSISIDARGGDLASISRLEGQLARLKQGLPHIIVGTVQHARKRRAL